MARKRVPVNSKRHKRIRYALNRLSAILVLGIFHSTITFAYQTGETSCFQDPDEVCYLTVTERGRTLSGIYEPEKFKPFIEINDRQQFDLAWQENPFYVLANLSHAAYMPDDELMAMLLLFGGQGTSFDFNGNQGYLAIWSDKIILVFRGTDEPENILNNIKIKTVQMNGIPVHRGFRNATLDLWENTNLLPELEKAQRQNTPESKTYVTGHSLGASMSVIASLLYPFDRVITFGEPRVGNDIGTIMDNTTEHFRIVNGNDNVTLVPPEILGYAHHGIELKIRDPLEISNEISITGINADHSIVNYCRNLWLQGKALSQNLEN